MGFCFSKILKICLPLGHSRTVVGIEEKKNKALCLLLFDPGCPSQEMQKLLKLSSDGTSLKLLRKFMGSLKEKQYQIVTVNGVLTLEEKTVSILGNRFCVRTFKRTCIKIQNTVTKVVCFLGEGNMYFFFFSPKILFTF